MLWIKRNLIFVICIAVGLLLTGYCGYLLYSSLDANSGVSDEYLSTLNSLKEIQQKTPFPSKENIKAAKEDQDRVRLFLADFKKSFAPFPPPPLKDEKGFKTYLEDSLVRFRAEATNAGVALPTDYAFAFSGLKGKLTYLPGNIEPWMQQLEEISTILDVLYRAKINYLDSLCRVPISSDDAGGADCLLQSATVTNQWGVVTPHKVTFRGFSAEIAAVLEGFARSSNCFIVKSVDVAQDKTVQSLTVEESPSQRAMTAYAPPPQYANPPANRLGRDRGLPGMRLNPFPVAPSPVASAAVPAASTGPVTILSEGPLLVTVSVDVVKLKASEH